MDQKLIIRINFDTGTAWKVSVLRVILVRMQENADLNDSKYGHFSSSGVFSWEYWDCMKDSILHNTWEQLF